MPIRTCSVAVFHVHPRPKVGLPPAESARWFASVYRQSWEHRHVSPGFDGEGGEHPDIAATWLFPGFVLREAVQFDVLLAPLTTGAFASSTASLRQVRAK